MPWFPAGRGRSIAARVVMSIEGLPRYLMVGGGLALCNLGLLWVLVEQAQWPLLWAYVASFAILNFAGYAFNKFYSFRLERRLLAAELLRYYAVMAVSLTANLCAMWMMVHLLHWHYLMASSLLAGALALVNYLGHRHITFGGRTPPSAALSQRTDPRSKEVGCANLRVTRVLQVSAFFPAHGGGIEAVAGQLAAHLAEGGASVHWMAGGSAAEMPAQPVAPGVSIEQARSFDPLEQRLGLPAPLWAPSSVQALWHSVGKSDLVQVHDYLYMPTLLAFLFAKLRSKPIVLTQHIGQIPFKARLPRLILAVLNRSVGALVLRAADQVVFISAPVLHYFEHIARFGRLPLLVPNGVDHTRYRPAERINSPIQRPLVSLLFVGRFVEKKGLLLLRHCLALPTARWTFIGWGPLSPLASDASEQAHPSATQAGFDNVEVLGRMAASDIVQHYQQADLLVLPSMGEGFPLVVQEALACGTPVLVSTEVFEAFPQVDARCVFHVELRGLAPKHAASMLRLKLEQLVAQPTILHSARAHAQGLAQQWGWAACVERYQGVYAALLDAPLAQ